MFMQNQQSVKKPEKWEGLESTLKSTKTEEQKLLARDIKSKSMYIDSSTIYEINPIANRYSGVIKFQKKQGGEGKIGFMAEINPEYNQVKWVIPFCKGSWADRNNAGYKVIDYVTRNFMESYRRKPIVGK